MTLIQLANCPLQGATNAALTFTLRDTWPLFDREQLAGGWDHIREKIGRNLYIIQNMKILQLDLQIAAHLIIWSRLL